MSDAQTHLTSPVKVNVTDVIDNSKFGPFHLVIMTLCGLCLIMDGFDVQAIGYVAPTLMREWKISPALLGSVLSAALVGVLFGSILLSMAADRFGRRPLLIGACLCFSVVTLATALAQTVNQLLILRFVAGVALGSIMPNAVSLAGEYSPKRLRVVTMMAIGSGFTLGAAVGGFVSFWLLPIFGWRSVFVFGGAIPLLVGTLMIFLLPESLPFMALRGSQDPRKMRTWLQRLDPATPLPANSEFVVREVRRKGVPLVKLFENGLAPRTLLLWILYFMNLLNLYFLSSWLPTITAPLVKSAGAPATYSVLMGSALQVGGVVGVVLGWVVQRLGFVPVLAVCFAGAAINIALIGHPGLTLASLFIVVFIAGFGIVGCQSLVNAFTGTLYPTDLRSTAIGSGLGVGRIGSIVGPLLAGQLIALHWSTQKLFLAAAAPALASVVIVIALYWAIQGDATPGPKEHQRLRSVSSQMSERTAES